MRRLIEHKIDRPNTQCMLIARVRKTYFQLNVLRRNCSKKNGKKQVRQEVQRALKAKKEARALKQAQREEKKRTKRGKNLFFLTRNRIIWAQNIAFLDTDDDDDEDYEEVFEDESLNEVFDASALEEMGMIQQNLSGKISTESLQERFFASPQW